MEPTSAMTPAAETLAANVEIAAALPGGDAQARERWDLDGAGVLEGALERA